MKHIFRNKRISSIISVLPPTIVRYEDELSDYNFPELQSKRLGMMMDYHTRRECASNDGLSDYALQGIQFLINHGIIKKEDIDGIVVVSSSQDYIMPSVSYILQGRLELSVDTYCCDVINACGGYVNGLVQSFMALDTLGLRKILLVTGDMLTKKVCKHDRNSRPIIGDAVNISIVENYHKGGDIYVDCRNFGDKAEAIKIPAGGLKIPSTASTAVEEKDDFGNYRALDHFYMDGDSVFNFVMTQVPSMIIDVIKTSGNEINTIDYFMFHQPNKYMVNRLMTEIEIPNDKIFANIVGIYGNASTGTIPLNICHNIAQEATSNSLRLCLSGFGAGLTCNALVMQNPAMDYCSIIDYKA